MVVLASFRLAPYLVATDLRATVYLTLQNTCLYQKKPLANISPRTPNVSMIKMYHRAKETLTNTTSLPQM